MYLLIVMSFYILSIYDSPRVVANNITYCMHRMIYLVVYIFNFYICCIFQYLENLLQQTKICCRILNNLYDDNKHVF